ncbi:MAG: chitinase [Flavobacteriales bacterium]|jgi:chitinase
MSKRKMTSIKSTVLTLGLALLLPVTALADVKVVGYIPSYKNITQTIDQADLTKLTHINLAFVNPDSSGQIISAGNLTCMKNGAGVNVSGADFQYVVDTAHAAGVKVMASVAGGLIPACSGNWQTLLQAGNRQALVANLIQFIDTYNLDGLDIDIEGVLLTDIDNAGNYTPFIQLLSSELKSRGKLLTAATATYAGGMIPVSSIPYFDFVTLMSYDAIGPTWGAAGTEHSTYAGAQSHINTWKSRGLSKDKLVLGVPFYGYGFGDFNGGYSYADILAQFGVGAANNDVIGTVCSGCSYITYNGIPTIQAKTQLAVDQGAGVMIWELSHDVSNSSSLLSSIWEALGSSSSCPVWSSGQQYLTGDIVRFTDGNNYIAVHDNPGYDPTISTWFWDPTSENCGAASFEVRVEAENYSSMAGVQLEGTQDTDGELNVGWIDSGDWMAYGGVIDVPASGNYEIQYRVASPSGGSLSADLDAGSVQLGSVVVPATQGWQNWTNVSHVVSLPAGQLNLGIFAQQGGWNINWFKIKQLP